MEWLDPDIARQLLYPEQHYTLDEMHTLIYSDDLSTLRAVLLRLHFSEGEAAKIVKEAMARKGGGR